MKTFICRLVNNLYNRRFRVEVCQMKQVMLQQCEYLLQEGVLDAQKIDGYFLDLQRQGYSSIYIGAIVDQASAELEHLT